MLFEILRDDKVVMHTKDGECIPPLDTLHKMADAKYTFKKDGKPYKPPAKRGRKKGDKK